MEFSQHHLILVISILASRADSLIDEFRDYQALVKENSTPTYEQFERLCCSVFDAKDINEVIIKLASRLNDGKMKEDVLDVAKSGLKWQTRFVEDMPIKVTIGLEHIPNHD